MKQIQDKIAQFQKLVHFHYTQDKRRKLTLFLVQEKRNFWTIQVST